MSLRRYSSYRDSEAKWLGAVPHHWTLKRLAHYFDERRTKVSDRDYPPLSVTKNGIVPQLETAAKTDDGDNRKLVLAGDLVINSRSDRKGSSGLSEFDGSVSLINTVLDPSPDIDGGFAHHLLRSVSFQEEYYRFGKGIVADLWSTNFSEMRNILLAVPPLSEQRDIAAFLRRETAKIDALVEEQRRLIVLLKEKRQGVISHAVTKGLDPAAPLKATGVEWIGEAPEHWCLKRLKWVTVECCDGPFGSGLKSDHYVESGVRVIRLQNIKSTGFDCTDAAFIDTAYFNAELRRHEVRALDLLIAGLGDDRNVVGRACVAPPDIGAAMVKADCFRFRLRPDDACVRFVAEQLNAGAKFAAGKLANGTTRSRIPLSVTANRVLALPPVKEQEEIAKQISARSADFDRLLEEASSAINLLQERRAALISAAVTGKIDVRRTTPQKAQAA